MPFTSRRPEGARPPPPPPLRGGGGRPPGPGGRWGEVAVPRGQGWHPAECPLPPPLPPPRGWAALARAPRSRGAVSGTAPAAAGNGGTPQGQRDAPQVPLSPSSLGWRDRVCPFPTARGSHKMPTASMPSKQPTLALGNVRQGSLSKQQFSYNQCVMLVSFVAR